MSRRPNEEARPEETAAARFNPNASPSSKRDWIFGLVLMMAIIVAYQSVWHAGFIWDDDAYVTENWTLHDFNGLKHIWFDTTATPQYYPLVHTTFWLEYHGWKLNPTGYHIVNVLLHALGSILLWRVLKRLELPGAWLAAAVFALHPVNVESVAWITERKNVLSAVFFFAAAWAYLRFVGETASNPPRWGWWFVALLLFVCALLSKTVTCSLPAVLLLVRWWKKERLEMRDVLPTGPFFVVGLWLGLQTAWLEQHHAGASGAEWSFSFVERCLIAGWALWFYAGKLIWPINLTFIYPRWQIDAGIWWQWLFPVAVLALVATLWFARKRIGRGPLVAFLFFAGTLLPALGFVSVYPMRYSFVADHFQYLAGIGMIVLAIGGMTMALERWEIQKPFLKPMLYGLLLLTLGVLTWRQGGMYADVEMLWQTTIDRNPNCWMAHNNLGNALLKMRKVDEAIVHYQKALQIKPDHGEARYNLGNALLQKGSVDEAIVHYQKALQFKPDNAEVHNNLGSAFFLHGRMDEAITQFQKALEIKSDYADAHVNVGNALLHNTNLEEAIFHYQKALQIKPDYLQVQNDLAWLLATAPQASLRNGNKAVELAQQANQLSGGTDPVILHTLAAAYAEAGRFSEAIETAQRTLQLTDSQSNAVLTDRLRSALRLYQAGTPFHGVE